MGVFSYLFIIFLVVEIVMRKVTTLYLDPEAYSELKQLCSSLGISVSNKMDELVKKAVKELKGEEYTDAAKAINYEDLKRQHSRLDRDEEALTKKLRQRKVYDDLCSLAYKLGLDFKNCSNIDEVAPKLLREWDGGGDVHEFITLAETIWEKRQVERRLSEIRMKNFAAEEETEEPKPAKGEEPEGSEPVDVQAEAEEEEESEDEWEEEWSSV